MHQIEFRFEKALFTSTKSCESGMKDSFQKESKVMEKDVPSDFSLISRMRRSKVAADSDFELSCTFKCSAQNDVIARDSSNLQLTRHKMIQLVAGLRNVTIYCEILSSSKIGKQGSWSNSRNIRRSKN